MKDAAFGQPKVDQDLRTVRSRKELLRDEREAGGAGDQHGEGQRHDGSAAAHTPRNDGADGAVGTAVERAAMIGCLDLTNLEQAIADPRREIDGGEPRDHERDARHPEQGADVLAGLALREADRDEAGHGDKGARQHRERGGRVGERRSAELVVPFLELPVHHLDRDHGIVDKQPQRDDQGAKRDALQVDPHHRHDEERRGQHHRDGQGDDQAGAPAERQKRNHEHDADRLGQRLEKLVDRLADDLRLVRDAAELDADRQILLDALQSLLDGGAHLGDVGTGHHGEGGRRLAPRGARRH